MTDRTGQYIAGADRGRQVWRHLSDDIIAANGAAGVYLSNHIYGTCRITDADAAGVYGIGASSKVASGAGAADPIECFPVAGAVIPDGQLWIVGAVFAVNGTAVPTNIDVGFYPVTVGGGAGTITYTLDTTGKIVQPYATLAASGIDAVPSPDRRADFVSGGNQNYALGLELSSALPAGCVVDLALSLQLS